MTKPPDALAQRFRAAVPESDGSTCGPADEYWAAASGELPFERVQALVDHGARCAQCAEAWRILGEVRRAAVDPAVDDPASPLPLLPRRRSLTRTLLPLALSALAAALFVALRPAPPPPPPPSVERGNGVGSMHAESPAVQPVRDAVLRWSEVPGATSYNVTVLTPDLVVVHQAVGLSTHELRLPESVGQRAAGGGLLWNVDAVLPDGHTVASPTFELRLK